MEHTRLERLALASATHPRWTIGAWIVATLLAFVTIGALLGGALTTEGNPTNDPQSQRAKDVREATFPAASAGAITDIVVVRSPRYTVDAPEYRCFVRELGDKVGAAKDVESVRTYLGARNASLVSPDRHSTMVQFAMPDDTSSGIDDVIDTVRTADAH